MKKIIFICISSLLFACSEKKQADLIVHHALIYTVDSSFSTAESFAVKDGKFIAVGTNEDILNSFDAKEVIDAGGKTIFPGFIDSHCHFYGYGKGLHEVDLTGTVSFEEVLERTKQFSTNMESEWIIGRGWDQNDWKTKEFPDRKKLDSLFPSTPVFLKRIDGHAALANSEALKRAGINKWQKVEGGTIGTYSDIKNKDIAKIPFEELSGILIDNAVDLVERKIPQAGKEQIFDFLLSAQKNCFEVGLTTVDDAGLEKKIIDAIDELQKKGELKMRIYGMLTDNKENLDHYLKAGPYKTDRLNVRSFKCYADGALGSRGACLCSAYSDKPEEQGFLLKSPVYYDSIASLLIRHGFQMNTHCIGDSASALITKIYLDHLVSNSTASPSPILYRWRIEHAQVVKKEDFKLYSAIIPSVQPTHATSDMYWAKDRIGEERIKYAYAYNELLRSCGMIALGTDFPVENINPFYTFYAAVARKDLKGYPEKGFQPENALSRENTLKGMTIWGAYANFEEKEKGSIEPGKFADFILLDKDIMKCDIDKVPSTKVMATFVNGENVFQRK